MEQRINGYSLMNCPFCGNPAILLKRIDKSFSVHCWPERPRKCSVRPVTETYETKESAVWAWNTRHSE